MNKEDFLQEEIEIALNKIDFINKYESIAQQFTDRSDSFKIKNEDILVLGKKLGYDIKYSKQTEFYSSETLLGYNFKIGFTIRYNSFDFGLSIINNDKNIKSSAPWDFLVQLMTEGEKKISRVKFRNHKDVEIIIKNIYIIYEDLKKEILNSTYPA